MTHYAIGSPCGTCGKPRDNRNFWCRACFRIYQEKRRRDPAVRARDAATSRARHARTMELQRLRRRMLAMDRAPVALCQLEPKPDPKPAPSRIRGLRKRAVVDPGQRLAFNPVDGGNKTSQRKTHNDQHVLSVPSTAELNSLLDELSAVGFFGTTRESVACALLSGFVERECDHWRSLIKTIVPRLK